MRTCSSASPGRASMSSVDLVVNDRQKTGGAPESAALVRSYSEVLRQRAAGHLLPAAQPAAAARRRAVPAADRHRPQALHAARRRWRARAGRERRRLLQPARGQRRVPDVRRAVAAADPGAAGGGRGRRRRLDRRRGGLRHAALPARGAGRADQAARGQVRDDRGVGRGRDVHRLGDRPCRGGGAVRRRPGDPAVRHDGVARRRPGPRAAGDAVRVRGDGGVRRDRPGDLRRSPSTRSARSRRR